MYRKCCCLSKVEEKNETTREKQSKGIEKILKAGILSQKERKGWEEKWCPSWSKECGRRMKACKGGGVPSV